MADIMILGDMVCDVCIEIMMAMSKSFGISYGTLNVLLFVILGPLSTIVFMANSFIQLIGQCKNKYKYNIDRSKKYIQVNIILSIIGILIVVSVITAIAYAFLFNP